MKESSSRTRVTVFTAHDAAGRKYCLQERCEFIAVSTRAGEREAITNSVISTIDGEDVRCIKHQRYVIVASGTELIADTPERPA
jgi:hypothetical protein